MHESLEELSLWEEVVSRLSKSHLGTLRGGKPLEEAGRQRPQLTPPHPHIFAFCISQYRLIQKGTIYFFPLRKWRKCVFVKVSQGAWVALINKNNCLLFSSHLTSCMVNTGKCFRNVSGNLCFIRDALHLVLAELPLAWGHLCFQSQGCWLNEVTEPICVHTLYYELPDLGYRPAISWVLNENGIQFY